MINLGQIKDVTGGRLIQGNLQKDLPGISIDTRTIKPGQLFIAIKGNRFDGHDFLIQAKSKGAAGLIVSNLKKTSDSLKNIPIICVSYTPRALGDIAKFHRRQFSPCVIAITGTNGKTTTKDMLASILEKKSKVLKSEGTQNNQIGLPLALLRLNQGYKYCVLEMGTNHPGEIRRLTEIAEPEIGIIINIGLGHLEGFLNLENVFQEKFELFKNLKTPAISLFNADDPILNKNCRQVSRAFSFAIQRPSDFRARGIYQKFSPGTSRPADTKHLTGFTPLDSKHLTGFTVNRSQDFKLNTVGLFNIYNSLAAIGCARILGIGNRIIKQALGSFKFPKSRLQVITKKKVMIIDDSYNSNPLSLELAIETLSKFNLGGRRILVMADMLELGNKAEQIHAGFAKSIKEAGIDLLVTVGQLAKITGISVREEGMDKVFICNYNQEVASVLREQIRPGDAILVKGSRSMHLEEVVGSLSKNL